MSDKYLIKIDLDSTSLSELGTSAVLYSYNWSETPTVQVLFENLPDVYEGLIDTSSWREIAETLEIDPENYHKDNQLALTNIESTGVYKYSVQRNQESLTFSWSKVIGVGSLKCGCVDLKINKNLSAFNLLSSSSSVVNNLQKVLQKSTKKLSTFEREQNRLIEESKKILESRVAAEEHLFDKFHILLNEKKRKIRDLEQDQY